MLDSVADGAAAGLVVTADRPVTDVLLMPRRRVTYVEVTVRSVLRAAVVAVAALCVGCSSDEAARVDPPLSVHSAARVISDGVAKLSAVEARLAAASADEPRRTAGSDAAGYFAAVASTAQEGVLVAAQLRTSVDSLNVTGVAAGARRDVMAALEQLSAGYAALVGACEARDVAAARRARQTIATVMVTLQTAAPHLGG